MFRWYHKSVKKYERWIFGVILAIIVVSFAASGVSTEVSDVMGGGKKRGDLALETPGGKVTREEFDNFVYRWTRGERDKLVIVFFGMVGMRGLYEGEEQMKIYFALLTGATDRQVVNRVALDAQILMAAARDAGLRVTEEEIRAFIKATMFGREGGYTFEAYREKVDQRYGLKPDEYELSIGELLLCQKYVELLSEGVAVADEDVLNEYVKVGERSKAKYVFYSSASDEFKAQAKKKVTQRELADFLKSSQGSFGFKREESARLEYVAARFDELKKGVGEPTDAEVKEYYEKHKEEFRRTVLGPELPPEDGHSEHDGHDHDGTPEGTPAGDPAKPAEPAPPAPDPYKTLEECRTDVIEAWKLEKARHKAFEVMAQVKDRIFKLQMAGTVKPDFGALAAEFKLEPGTTAWFDEVDTKPVDDQLGTPAAGNPSWAELTGGEPKDARATQVRTTKGHLYVRLVEKRPAETYLATETIRRKALDKVAGQAASTHAKKAAESLRDDFTKRYGDAYAEKTKVGAQLTDQQIADLRIEVFARLLAERKVKVEETRLVSRDDTLSEVPDARPFLTELFNIEANGDVRVAYGNSGTYVVQRLDRKPASATGFALKRTSIENRMLMDKRRRFTGETFAQYKKDNCKIHIELESAAVEGE